MTTPLSRYHETLAGKSRPRFRQADLHQKSAAARQILQRCELCAHACQADRLGGEIGTCGATDKMQVASAFNHYGEEPFFVPSYTVFFRGCTLSCQFCQNWDISQDTAVRMEEVMEPARLARLINENRHCKNVNFVGGEPTPYLPFILDTLSQVTVDIPVVWNSNFYMSPGAIDLLAGTVDVYLSDFKFGNDRCASRLARIPEYSTTVRRNHKAAFEDADLVIRHLVLPNHVDCCTKPIFEFLAENFGDRAIVNIMDQYRPAYNARAFKDIDRPLNGAEFRRAVDYARHLGLNYMT